MKTPTQLKIKNELTSGKFLVSFSSPTINIASSKVTVREDGLAVDWLSRSVWCGVWSSNVKIAFVLICDVLNPGDWNFQPSEPCLLKKPAHLFETGLLTGISTDHCRCKNLPLSDSRGPLNIGFKEPHHYGTPASWQPAYPSQWLNLEVRESRSAKRIFATKNLSSQSRLRRIRINFLVCGLTPF
jgi:hypothetical protein